MLVPIDVVLIQCVRIKCGEQLHTEVFAAANMFQVNVCVWAKFGSMHTLHIHRPKGTKILKDSMYLENTAGNHFNVVIHV